MFSSLSSIQSNIENKSQNSIYLFSLYSYNSFNYLNLLNSDTDKFYYENYNIPQLENIKTGSFIKTQNENILNSNSITDSFNNPQVNNIWNNKKNFEKPKILYNPSLSANLLSKEEHSIKIIIENSNYNINNDKENFINNNSNKKEKKRGRDKKILNSKRIHDKFSKDNILRKLQTHYLAFLTNFANLLIKQILFEDKDMQFYSLKHKFFKNINKNRINLLKKQSLSDILKCTKIPQCKSAKNNTDVYNKITSKSIIIKNIIDKPYLEYFQIYYNSKKKICLSKYGYNQYIILPNDIQLFEDLIKKNKTNSEIDDEKYRKKIETIIHDEFLQGPKQLFKCLKI